MPKTTPATRSLPATLRDALAAVAAGRVQYGHAYPARERRAAAAGRSTGLTVWLLDGAEVYGQGKRTFTALEDRDLIRTRMDLLPTRRAPERTAERKSISGAVTTHVLPEHDEPADPGWRVAVEVTDAGREALA